MRYVLSVAVAVIEKLWVKSLSRQCLVPYFSIAMKLPTSSDLLPVPNCNLESDQWQSPLQSICIILGTISLTVTATVWLHNRHRLERFSSAGHSARPIAPLNPYVGILPDLLR